MEMNSLRLLVEGEVAAPREFGFDDLAALAGQVDDVGALIPGREGGAGRLAAILRAGGPSPAGRLGTAGAGGGRESVPGGGGRRPPRKGLAAVEDEGGLVGELRFGKSRDRHRHAVCVGRRDEADRDRAVVEKGLIVTALGARERSVPAHRTD